MKLLDQCIKIAHVMDIKLYVTVKYAVFGAEAEAADVHIHHQGYIPCDFIDHSHLVKTLWERVRVG